VREFRFAQAHSGQRPYRLIPRKELPRMGKYQGNR
jgi:hypothetical protein